MDPAVNSSANPPAESSDPMWQRGIEAVRSHVPLCRDIEDADITMGHIALITLTQGIVTKDEQLLLDMAPVSVEWDGKQYLLNGDIEDRGTGYRFCLQYQLDRESERIWVLDSIAFQYSTEEEAWLDIKSGKRLSFEPECPLDWMRKIDRNKDQVVNIRDGVTTFKGIIRRCALKNLDVRAKRKMLVWTEYGNQYTDAHKISASLPVGLPETLQELSSCFFRNRTYAHAVLVVQDGVEFNIDIARQLCLVNCRIIQSIDWDDFKTYDTLLNTDFDSKLKGILGYNYNSDSVINRDESDAHCADMACKGTHHPDVHILLLRSLDANKLFWIYRHIEMGYKLILLLHSIHQFRQFMPDNWLMYEDSTVSRLLPRARGEAQQRRLNVAR